MDNKIKGKTEIRWGEGFSWKKYRSLRVMKRLWLDNRDI